VKKNTLQAFFILPVGLMRFNSAKSYEILTILDPVSPVIVLHTFYCDSAVGALELTLFVPGGVYGVRFPCY